MPGVTLDGVSLWVRRDGRADGAPVVFLHGLGSSADDWRRQVPAFTAEHRVLRIDLRGHGRSRPARGRLTIEGMARDVADTLAVLGEPAAHVVGLSLGGCVGLALAAARPERVRSLTLVNTFARLRPAGVAGLVRAAQRIGYACFAPMPRQAAHIARRLFPRPDQEEAYRACVASLSDNSRRVYLGSLAAIAGFDARPLLRRVACPALVVVGDRDTTVPRAAADVLCLGIPRSRLLVVCDSGHATPIDQWEIFNREVLAFLRATAGTPAPPAWSNGA